MEGKCFAVDRGLGNRRLHWVNVPEGGRASATIIIIILDYTARTN